MSKKEEMMREFEEMRQQGELDCVILFIHMPTGETEAITNQNVEEKMKYVDKTYSDDLVHGNCKEIYIEEYIFVPASELMDFGQAITALKDGCTVARKGWNGKKQYIELARGISYLSANGEEVNCEHDAIGNMAIAFVGTSGVQMGWLASQADMLAEDWYIASEHQEFMEAGDDVREEAGESAMASATL